MLCAVAQATSAATACILRLQIMYRVHAKSRYKICQNAVYLNDSAKGKHAQISLGFTLLP